MSDVHARAPADVSDPRLFINRELSMLEFDRRVLEQAREAGTPLLERLRFLGISSTNLDEFFEIRASGLRQQVAFGVSQPGPDGLTPQDVLAQIGAASHRIVEEQYRLLNETLLPELEAQGIRVLPPDRWSARQARWLRRYFTAEVMPVLTPMGLDPAHPFPRVLNKSLCFVVQVEGADAFGRGSGIAVVQVPRSLPRLLPLPPEVRGGAHDFVLLSSLVEAHVREIFPGMSVTGCHAFRCTRNSDLWVDEEEVDNLLQALKGELPSRHYGDAVRLEVAEAAPAELAQDLLQQLGLLPADLYRCRGPVNLHRLSALHELVDRPDLKFPPFQPGLPRRLTQGGDLFAVLRRGDVLLHHPYESFTPVIELVRQAAADPAVLAIKMTLYRTGPRSPLGEALIEAARAGKEVTAVIELRARFDEAANIDLATRLQEAGASVVYGVVGYKAHAKLLLVVRREGRQLRRYAHLGTGNYHPGTARAYTDFSLLTADRQMGEDVHKVFLQMTGLGKVMRLSRLLHSPFSLHRTLIALIDNEAERARQGRTSGIRAKMNSLAEPGVIRALYRASQAGVPIDLIVRGACCLRPGVPGVSETIRVRSIIGRFLEHSRVWCFHADGEELTFLSSADWMERNFFRRVETAFPVLDARLKARLLHEGLAVPLSDTAQAWALGADGRWKRIKPGAAPRCAQRLLLEELGGRGGGEAPDEESPRQC
ncbi:MAG: polyphosphate kinase 1 [Planctomycetes bacterium]|nr:polyphosphate kinase 1 [Planctomycetota bacterium]